MKNEKMIRAWDKLEPSETADLRMRVGILEQNRRAREKRMLERGGRAKMKRLLPIAACLALLIVAVGIVWDRHNGSGHKGDPEEFPGIVLEFNDSYYEITDKRAFLERSGLPAEITAELAGGHAAYLRPGLPGEADYEVSAEQTDIELLEYAPAPCKGVYIFRDGTTYSAALFCNVHHGVKPMELLYQIYGVEGAEDIVSVTELDWDRDQVLGEAVTDRDEIEAFYSACLSLNGFGSVPDMSRDEERTAEYAVDHRDLCVETRGGLRFPIDVYPSFGVLYASGIMTYYCCQPEEPMAAWIQQHLN